MRAKQLLTIAVVSTLLLGGMAALGAAAPADQAPDTATDAAEENAPTDAGEENAPEGDEGDRANGDSPGNADGVGPSGGLPEQVPDHVIEIHDRIDSFLNGSIDNLGESLGELLGDDGAADNSDGAADDTADGAENDTEDDADA